MRIPTFTELLVKQHTSFNVLIVVCALLFISANILIDWFFSNTHQGWMTLTVLAIIQFSPGTWIQQTLLRGITIVLAVSSVACIRYLVGDNASFVLWILSFLLTSYCLILQEVNWRIERLMFVFFFMLAQLVSSAASLQAQLLDIISATGLMLCASIFATSYLIQPFFIRLIKRYLNHLISLTNTLLTPHAVFRRAHNLVLLQQTEWVYMLGLSPGLRSGFRYYVLQLERTELLLHSLMLNIHTILPYPELITCFEEVMHSNKQLLQLITEYFDHHINDKKENDWMQDIILFEQKMHQLFPIKETMHLHPDDLSAIAFLRSCKDLRQVVLQLGFALPSY